MENEYAVLSHLQENEITTQRTISKHTGISLGAVNLLLKKMVRKGLIKIEKLNPRTMRYILTPQGLHEKSRLTYRYIRKSYKQILKINQVLDEMLSQSRTDGQAEEIILLGPADEIREILVQYLSAKDISHQVFENDGSLEKVGNDSNLVIIWREEEEEFVDHKQAVNMMALL